MFRRRCTFHSAKLFSLRINPFDFQFSTNINHHIHRNFSNLNSIFVHQNFVSQCLYLKSSLNTSFNWHSKFDFQKVKYLIDQSFFPFSTTTKSHEESTISYELAVPAPDKKTNNDMVINQILIKLNQIERSNESNQLIDQIDILLQDFRKDINENQINGVLGRIQTHNLLLAFYDWANSTTVVKCDNFSYNIVISSLCRLQKFEEMEKFVEEMKSFGIHPDLVTFADIIKAYCNANYFDKAMEEYEKMRLAGISPNAVTYNIMIGLLTKKGNYDDALQLYKEMRTDNIDLNSSLCTTLISLFGKMRRFEDINTIFHTMKSSPNCYPSAHTYSLLIDIHLKAKHYDDVLKLVKEMKLRKVMPSNVTFNTLLVVYDALGMFSEISKLKNDMKLFNIVPDTGWYNTLMKLYVRDNKFQLVENEYLNMKLNGIRLDEVSYNTLIHSYIAKCLYDKASGVLQEMKSQKIHPSLSTYVLLFQFWVDCNCLSYEMELWELLSQVDLPLHDSLETLINNEKMTDDLYENVINSLINDVSTSNFNHRLVLFNALIEYFNKSNRQKVGFLLWGSLRKTNFFPNVVVENGSKWSIDFHGFSSFTAEIILRYEFYLLHKRIFQEEEFPEQISIITGKSYGFNSKSVKNGVILVLRIMDFPFGKETSQGGAMYAEGKKVKQWLLKSSITSSLLADKISFILSNLNLINSLDVFRSGNFYHKNNVDWLKKHKIMSKKK